MADIAEKYEENLKTPDEEFDSAFSDALEGKPSEPAPVENTDKVDTEEENNKEDNQEDQTDPNEEIVKDLESYNEDDTDYKALYEKEVQRTKSWEGRIRAANEKAKSAEEEKDKLIEQLEAAKANSKTLNIDLDASDAELMKEFPSEYPDLHKAMTIIATAIAREVVLDQLNQNRIDTTPIEHKIVEIEERIEEREITDHQREILKAHKDAPLLVDGNYVVAWIKRQPSHLQGHLMHIYQEGNTQEVIDLFSDFKQSTGWKTKSKGTNNEKSKKSSKLDNMVSVGGDNTPINTDVDEGPDENDFSSAFAEASSAKT